MRRLFSKRVIITTASACCALGMLDLSTTGYMPTLLLRQLFPDTPKIAALRLNPITGRATIHGLHIPLHDGFAHVGEIAFITGYGLIRAAHAAENVALKNVTVETADFTYRAPAIEITGSSLSQKDFSGLLEKGAGDQLSKAIATLSAASISIPEAVAERKLQALRQTYSFRKLMARDIAAGKATSVSADGGTITGPSPTDGTFGAVNGRNLDIAQLVRAMAAAPATPDAEPTDLAALLSVNTVALKTSSGGAAFGRIAASDVKIQLGASPKRFLPLLGAVTLSDAVFDTVRAQAPNEKIRWTAKTLMLAADGPRDSVPTKFTARIDALTVPVPPNATDPTFKNLTELGYTAVVFSLAADAAWNPQTSDFDVKQISLSGADFGTITFSATLGAVGKDVFSGDKTVAQAAYKRATAKSLGVTVENKGLYEHIVAREAKKRGKSLDDTSKELSLSAALTFTTMTSNTAAGNVIAAAVGKFVAKPGKLRVNVTSKDAAGIALSSLSDPAARKTINDKINITATAE